MQLNSLQKISKNRTIFKNNFPVTALNKRERFLGHKLAERDQESVHVPSPEETAERKSERHKFDTSEVLSAEEQRAENISISVYADEEGVAMEVRDTADERLIIRFPVESAVQTHDTGNKYPGALLDTLL